MNNQCEAKYMIYIGNKWHMEVWQCAECGCVIGVVKWQRRLFADVLFAHVRPAQRQPVPEEYYRAFAGDPLWITCE